jgi:hypothetical protein
MPVATNLSARPVKVEPSQETMWNITLPATNLTEGAVRIIITAHGLGGPNGKAEASTITCDKCGNRVSFTECLRLEEGTLNGKARTFVYCGRECRACSPPVPCRVAFRLQFSKKEGETRPALQLRARLWKDDRGENMTFYMNIEVERNGKKHIVCRPLTSTQLRFRKMWNPGKGKPGVPLDIRMQPDGWRPGKIKRAEAEANGLLSKRALTRKRGTSP